MPLTACIRRPKLSDIQSSKMTGGVFRVAPGMFHPALAFSPSSLRELKHVSLPSFLAFFPSSSSMSTPCDLLAECVSDFSRSRLSHVMPRVFKRRSLSHFAPRLLFGVWAPPRLLHSSSGPFLLAPQASTSFACFSVSVRCSFLAECISKFWGGFKFQPRAARKRSWASMLLPRFCS